MIEKILKIEGIGRFQNTGGSSDDYRLTRETLIYAGNTHGKSTLTAILQSSKQNNPEIIKSRLTFGGSNTPLVSLRHSDGANINFNSKGWTINLEDLRVFDDKYIRESFFSPDEEINDEGQKTIETFILGAEGKELGKKANELSKRQTDNTTARSNITRLYTSKNSNTGISFQTFFNMEKDVGIDLKIKNSEDKLLSFQNQVLIKQSLNNIKTILHKYSVGNYIPTLSVAMIIDTRIITQHFQDHLIPGTDSTQAKQFIANGLSLQKSSEICVFCSQAINDQHAKKLTESYHDVFSTAYLSLMKARSNAVVFFESWNPYLHIMNEISNVQKLGLEINLNEHISKLKDIVDEILPELELKKNSAYQINVSLFDKASEQVNIISDEVDLLVSQYDQDLSEKSNTERGNLAFLKLHKSRFELFWDEQCILYSRLQKEHDDEIKPTLDSTHLQLKTYADTIYSNCMKSINECLQDLGTNFQIKDLKHKGRSRSDLFSLVFENTHDVGIYKGSSVSAYSTRHTLSESDKRALCFAFFIGSIQHEKKLGNIVLLMDDPASSFDFERRTSMATCLRSLMSASTAPSQIIILTHDRDFAKTIDIKFHDSTEYSSLLLEWDATKKSSDFKKLDIKTNHLFISDFYKNLDKVHKYSQLNDSELDSSHLQIVRHLIENLMKRKYFDKLKADIERKKSIETFVKTLSNPGMPYENKESLIRSIQELLPHSVHHDQDNPGGYDQNNIGPADVRIILQKTLTVLEEI